MALMVLGIGLFSAMTATATSYLTRQADRSIRVEADHSSMSWSGLPSSAPKGR